MRKILLIALSVMFAFSCSQLEKADADSISIKTITLEVGFQESATKASIEGIKTSFAEGDVIKINGNDYTVTMDAFGKYVVTIPEASSYNGWYPASAVVWSSGLFSSIKLQPAHYYNPNDEANKAFGKFYPLWADPSTNTSTALIFKPMTGVISLKIKGSSSTLISSIKVENRASAMIENAISGDFALSDGILVPKVSEPRVFDNWVTLNCGTGVPLCEDGTVFFIPLPARVYSNGLKITICDTNHKAMTIVSSTSRTIERGEILNTPAITYAVPENLLWCEYFDVLVWGSDYVGYKTGRQPATITPSRSDIAVTNVATSTSFQNMLSSTSSIPDYRYIFKPSEGKMKSIAECPGYMAFGRANNNTYGYITLPPIAYTGGDVVISFDMARNISDAAASSVTFNMIDGGNISSVKRDSEDITSYLTTNSLIINTSGTEGVTGKLIINPSVHPITTKQWRHYEVRVCGLSNKSHLQLSHIFENTSDIMSRVYFDNIEFKKYSVPTDPPTPPSTTFVHPGVLITSDDISRIQNMIANRTSPVYDAYTAIAGHNYAKFYYPMYGPWSIIGRTGTYTTTTKHERDFAVALYHAVLWSLEREISHGDKVIDILYKYATTLTAIGEDDNDRPLCAGFDTYTIVRAMELLKHTGYIERTTDPSVMNKIAAIDNMLTIVFLPSLQYFYTRGAYSNGNWGAVVTRAYMALGIYFDNQDMYDAAKTFFLSGADNGSIAHYIRPSGQCQESGRDQRHVQLGLGALAEICEMAYKQGDEDLYNASSMRLLTGYEYTAKYNLGNDVPFEEWSGDFSPKGWTTISSEGRGEFLPYYEVVYNHYVRRKGLAAPYTLQVLETSGVRPEVGLSGSDLQYSFGSMLFYNND